MLEASVSQPYINSKGATLLVIPNGQTLCRIQRRVSLKRSDSTRLREHLSFFFGPFSLKIDLCPSLDSIHQPWDSKSALLCLELFADSPYASPGKCVFLLLALNFNTQLQYDHCHTQAADVRIESPSASLMLILEVLLRQHISVFLLAFRLQNGSLPIARLAPPTLGQLSYPRSTCPLLSISK